MAWGFVLSVRRDPFILRARDAFAARGHYYILLVFSRVASLVRSFIFLNFFKPLRRLRGLGRFFKFLKKTSSRLRRWRGLGFFLYLFRNLFADGGDLVSFSPFSKLYVDFRHFEVEKCVSFARRRKIDDLFFREPSPANLFADGGNLVFFCNFFETSAPARGTLKFDGLWHTSSPITET